MADDMCKTDLLGYLDRIVFTHIIHQYNFIYYRAVYFMAGLFQGARRIIGRKDYDYFLTIDHVAAVIELFISKPLRQKLMISCLPPRFPFLRYFNSRFNHGRVPVFYLPHGIGQRWAVQKEPGILIR